MSEGDKNAGFVGHCSLATGLHTPSTYLWKRGPEGWGRDAVVTCLFVGEESKSKNVRKTNKCVYKN